MKTTKAPSLTLKETRTTSRVKVRPYVADRDYVINETLNCVRSVYPNDREILMGVIDLTTQLRVAEPNSEFVQDLRGFMVWASMTKQDARTSLTTIIHDLGEFSRNRKENWFLSKNHRLFEIFNRRVERIKTSCEYRGDSIKPGTRLNTHSHGEHKI